MKDWNIPDWRDATAYPETLTTSEWRWQFLRRRDDYRQDWVRDRPDYPERVMFGTRIKDMPSVTESGKIIEIGCREKYGVNFILHPGESMPCRNLFVRKPPHAVGFASEKQFKEYERRGIRLMAFDLRAPLAAQLKQAADYLARVQEAIIGDEPPEPRNHISKWPIYLRVLDAEADGAHVNEIAKVVFPEKQNGYPDLLGDKAVRNALAAAKRLLADMTK